MLFLFLCIQTTLKGNFSAQTHHSHCAPQLVFTWKCDSHQLLCSHVHSHSSGEIKNTCWGSLDPRLICWWLFRCIVWSLFCSMEHKDPVHHVFIFCLFAFDNAVPLCYHDPFLIQKFQYTFFYFVVNAMCSVLCCSSV